MRGEISYDLVMDDDMSLVEGTFRLPDTISIGLDVVKYDAKVALFRSDKPFREEAAADE